MRYTTLSALIILCMVSTSLQAASVPQRDPQALATISQAIQALGGMAPVTSIKDSIVIGASAPAPGSSTKPTTFVWKDAGGEFREEVEEGANTRVFVSGHGQPAAINNGTAHTIPPLVALANQPFHLPSVVLATELSDSRYSIKSDGPGTVENVPAIRVKIALDTDGVTAMLTQQEWYFDVTSGLPLRVDFLEPDTKRPDPQSDKAAFEFGDFRYSGGILVPFSITAFESGQASAIITIAKINFNQGLNSKEFDAPTGGGQ